MWFQGVPTTPANLNAKEYHFIHYPMMVHYRGSAASNSDNSSQNRTLHVIFPKSGEWVSMSMQLKRCYLQMTVLAATVHVKRTLPRGSIYLD